MPAKKNLITSANAREMQKKGAEKRKENAEKRKTAALIAQEVLDRVIKSKAGESKSVREILVEVVLGKSINEKDLSAIKYLLDLAGEGTTAKQQIDITSGGEKLEPITGMIILPPSGLDEKKAKAKKATTTKKKKQ